MSSPFFSVVIPTYNRRERLLRLLEEVARQAGADGGTEVIVADDGSDDGTGDGTFASHLPPGVRIVHCRRGGPGAARNAGAAEAGGEFLAFLEDDVMPAGDWLATARRLLRDDDVDVLEGRTVEARTKRSVRRFEPEPSASFIPCNLFVRRELFLQAGGYSTAYFDPESGLYFREDADLGFRLLEAGARHRIAQELLVAHPPQFPDRSSCFRHVRRYRFDPLLYREHPRLFRRLIEVKRIGGWTIRRPLHYVSLVHAAGLAGLAGFSAAGLWAAAAMAAALTAGTTLLAAWKYGRIARPAWFVVLPLVYLRALAGGSIRYRSFGVWR